MACAVCPAPEPCGALRDRLAARARARRERARARRTGRRDRSGRAGARRLGVVT